jgi:hypothetical protein
VIGDGTKEAGWGEGESDDYRSTDDGRDAPYRVST